MARAPLRVCFLSLVVGVVFRPVAHPSCCTVSFAVCAVCRCKIEQSKSDQQIVFGRHFDATCQLVSKLTRESIDLLKANFKDDLSEADWRLVVKVRAHAADCREG